jgi:hypothetical protein
MFYTMYSMNLSVSVIGIMCIYQAFKGENIQTSESRPIVLN